MRTGILITATTFALSSSVHGHRGDRIYPILEITEEAGIDLKDGLVDDWTELIGEPTFTALDFTGFESFHPDAEPIAYDPSDLDFRIWMGWSRDPDRLHVGAVFSDNRFVGEDEISFDYLLGQDHMNLMVDGDHDGSPRRDPRRSLRIEEDDSGIWNQGAQKYHAVSIRSEGPTVSLPPFGTIRRNFMVELPAVCGWRGLRDWRNPGVLDR